MTTDACAGLAAAPADHPDHPVCPDTFAAVYARHHPDALAQARRHTRDRHDAEDLAHDAFARLLAGAARTGIAAPGPDRWTDARAGTYIRQVVTNLVLDRWRATQRRPTPVPLHALPAEALPAHTPDDPVIRAETVAQVRDSLNLIPTRHRDALVLREVHELGTHDIADRLGIDQHNVKHVLNRARRTLRRHLAPEFTGVA